MPFSKQALYMNNSGAYLNVHTIISFPSEKQRIQNIKLPIPLNSQQKRRLRTISMMASSNQDHEPQVLVEKNSYVRTLTLNRPKQLNALSYPMIARLLELFRNYEEDSNVKLIVLKGKGRAFCAGGDVAAIVRDIKEGKWRLSADFFYDEYTLNYLIATYHKPQVSILNGIVMGGGVGVSVHGRFRVATENSVFAMPETALGLFPDIGATYFLARLPGFFGEYVGLTGARLDGAEMLACGLATHYVPSSRLGMLEAALHMVNSSDPTIISAIINEYSEKPILREQSAFLQLDVIDRCFSQRTVEEIIYALEKELTDRAHSWISTTLHLLKKASPTSLKISIKAMRQGRLLDINQCLVSEYRMLCHVMQGELSKDLVEGCRAILLDKDKNPKWEPSRLELISDSMVEKYFSKVNDDGWEDLKLPTRSNLSSSAISKL